MTRRCHSEVSTESTADLFWRFARAPGLRRVGIEIERVGIWADGSPLKFESDGKYLGASEILSELGVRFGWPLVDNGSGRPIGLASCCGKVSLEPGSQLELATETASSLQSLVQSVGCFERDVDDVLAPHGIHFIGIGVNPFSKLDATDVIALPRYHIMTDYLGRRDSLGTSMMRLTASVQVNLDYSSEKEAVEMLRVALMLTPLSYALFANSPWYQGERSPYLSMRGHIWRHTDPDRAGIPGFVFSPDFSFAKYAEHVWDLPLMFVQDEKGKYVAAHGATLKDIRSGKLPSVCANGINEMHVIRQVFSESRLKPGYIEVRSIDGQTPSMRYAAAAFWMGVLYSQEARQLVLDRFGRIGPHGIEMLWDQALKVGLKASLQGAPLLEVAQDLMEPVRELLRSRGAGEIALLRPLERVLESGKNPAQTMLDQFGIHFGRDAGDLTNFLKQDIEVAHE